MADVIKGIKINGTAYDLDLGSMGEQDNLMVTDEVGKSYELTIDGNGNIQLFTTDRPYTSLGDWGPFGVGTDATVNPKFTPRSQVATELGGSYISNLFRINSCFFGGEGTTTKTVCAATHNFVELANATDYDISLNGLYLYYLASGATAWKYIALKGNIPAHGTFLIRGAKCGVASPNSVVVDSYDMLWYDNGKLIEFSNLGGGFYLCMSDADKVYNWETKAFVDVDKLPVSNPWIDKDTFSDSAVTCIGYIDSCGLYSGPTKTLGEGGALSIKATEKTTDVIFFRMYGLDPGSATVLKAPSKRKSSSFWSYCNMFKEGNERTPYYVTEFKKRLQPKSSHNPKTFGSWHTRFNPSTPNSVNITLGKNGTSNASTGADRCFNWISVGCFDEFIEYKKVSDSSWTRKHSISKTGSFPYTSEYSGDATVEAFANQYDRITWVSVGGDIVTTHKAIIRGLSSGTYEFRIGRDSDKSYLSEPIQFVVKTDSEVKSGFNVVHHTDQQSFCYEEYLAWSKAAYVIGKNHTYDFTINTGDISQSGNRESEWLDYYEGKKYLGYGVPEMPVIGNNDLGSVDNSILSDGTANKTTPLLHTKINSMTIWYYYCFDLDPQNSCIFEYIPSGTIVESALGRQCLNKDEKDITSIKYFVPSMYSFNYGDFHFIMLNSEFATNDQSISLVYNPSDVVSRTPEFQGNVYYNEFKWLERDYELYGASKKCVACAHEIPFCIVKNGKTEGTKYDGAAYSGSNLFHDNRTNSNGSKLNKDFSAYVKTSPLGASESDADINAKYKGGLCYSEFFENNDIRLVLGGHKHTLSISCPTKENITVADGVRSTKPNEPIVAKCVAVNNSGTIKNNKKKYVTYIMEQATGYKLTSNKDVPGEYLPWLYHYYAGPGATTCKNDQQYPMYQIVTFDGTNSRATAIPYITTGIYTLSADNKIKAFNINSNNNNPGKTTVSLNGSDGLSVNYGLDSSNVTGFDATTFANGQITYVIEYNNLVD